MGHVFLGWGSEPCFSEFKRDGFETAIRVRNSEPGVAVRALDAGARVMATTRAQAVRSMTGSTPAGGHPTGPA